MIEVYPRLFIGEEIDYETKVKHETGWCVVHACKEPYHRQLLVYRGRGAPKEHPEYFLAERGNRLFLNIVDADDPEYIPKQIIDAALLFIEKALQSRYRVLVHCNLGESRSPSIGLLYMATHVSPLYRISLTKAETEFRKLYPQYKPKRGMKGFLLKYWNHYVLFKETDD